MALLPFISISIVSHAQGFLVKNLLEDLAKYCPQNIKVVLTLNIPESIGNFGDHYPFPILTIRNTQPKGFGENHNIAFQKSNAPFFCVMNPDVRLKANPFPLLIDLLSESSLGVIAPMVINEKGEPEDNARPFMSISQFLKRIFLRRKVTVTSPNPDWIAGMFMLFKTEAYKKINGFNEKYFLYCEDMDICARLKEQHYQIGYTSRVHINHYARRESHKNLRYLWWHINSLLRFWHYYYFKYPLRKNACI